MADELLQMFQSITTADHDELIDQFAFLLQLDVQTATFFLESSNWNVEVAVNNYLATVDFDGTGEWRRENNQGNDATMELDDDQQQQRQQGPDGMDDADAAPLMPGDYQAQFVTDLSAMQQTIFPPDTSVNVQWGFVNSGTTTWPSDTTLVFVQGEALGGPQQVPIGPMSPGGRIDVPIVLRSPSQMGSFAGNWRLMATPNGPFGDPVWLVLNVGPAKHDAFQPALDAPSVTATVVGGGANNDDDMMDL